MVDSPFKGKVLKHIHEDPIAQHSGYLKTYQRAKRDFHWVEMEGDIKRLVRNVWSFKLKNMKLCPLQACCNHCLYPQQAWIDISMDFIEGLPSSKGYSVIYVVVDRFNKYGHFIAFCHPYTA